MMVRGDVMKGTEKMLPAGFGNMLRAYRESTKGVTTKSGTPVFRGTNPLKGTAAYAVIRFFSFNPARMATIKEGQWSEKMIVDKYGDMRHVIYDAYRRFYLLPEEEQTGERMAELVRMVFEYNARVRVKGCRYFTPISGRDILAGMRRSFSAPKREVAGGERMREEWSRHSTDCARPIQQRAALNRLATLGPGFIRPIGQG